VNPAEILEQRRLEKRLTKEAVWSSAGMTSSEYQDVEDHGPEAFEVLRLHQLRRICACLDLDMVRLVDECLPAPFTGEFSREWARMRRNELILAARGRRGWTQDELADRIGFETVAVERMELEGAFLESWSVDLITELASVLGVPRTPLLTLGPEEDL